MLKCQYEMHKEKQIIRLCLAKVCNQKRKACHTCWLELHTSHQSDCITFPFIKLILLREQNILQKYQGEMQQSQFPNQQKLKIFNEMIVNILISINQSIENIQNEEFYQIDSIIQIAQKCHHGIIEQELLHQIIVDFNTVYEDILATPLKKKLKECYDQDCENFELDKCKFKGDDLFETHKFDQALIQYEIILQSRLTQELASKKFQCLMFMKKTNQAIQWINTNDDLLNVFQESFKALIHEFHLKQMINQNLFSLGLDGASKSLDEILDKAFKDCEILYLPGNSIQNLEYINQCLQQKPNSSDLLKQKCFLLMQLQNFDEALECLNQYFILNPNDQTEIHIIRDSLLFFKQMKLSQDNCFKEQNRNDDEYLFQKGLHLIYRQNMEEGFYCLSQITPQFAWYRQAQQICQSLRAAIQGNVNDNQQIQENQNSQDPIFLIGKLITQKKYQDALMYVEQLLTKYPKSKLLWFIKSFILLELKQINQAQECVQIAMAYHPENVALKYIYAFFLFHDQRCDETIQIADQILQTRNQFQCEALEVKGKSLYFLNELKKSIKCFEQLLQIDPNNIEARINKSYLLLYETCYDESLIELNKILNYDPSNQKALYYKGIALYNQGKFEQALEYLKRTLNFCNSRFYYANALGRTSRTTEALQIYKEYQVSLTALLKEINSKEVSQENLEKTFLLIGEVKRFDLILCDLLIKERKFEKALQRYGSYECNEMAKLLLPQYCMILIELNKYDDAQEVLSQNLKEDPYLIFIQGYLLELNQKNDESLFWYEKYINFNQNALGLHGKTNILKKMQRNPEALQTLNLLKVVYPNYNFEISISDSIYDSILFNRSGDIWPNDISKFEFLMLKTFTLLMSEHDPATAHLINLTQQLRQMFGHQK